MIKSKEDTELALKSQRALNNDLSKIRDELHSELENASAYIVELEDKFFK